LITERDKEIIKFINEFKVAHTSTLQKLFYTSDRVARRRLSTIVEHGDLKRERYYISEEYLYYIKKPKQMRHSLLLTDFYRDIYNIVEVKYFKNEVILDNIRPDALMGYKYKDKYYIAFIEVEISNKGFDIDKYKRFYITEQYKKYFPIFPLIIAITDKNISEHKKLKIIQIKEDLSNIQDIVKLI